MDGVMADFEGYAESIGQHPQVAKLYPTTYLDLEPMPGAIEGMRTILEAAPDRVFALTKIPLKNPNAATQKLIWLRHRLPELHDHVIITPDKGCVGRQQDVLVDDHPDWANAYAFPGRIIEFGINHSMNWEKLTQMLIEHLRA